MPPMQPPLIKQELRLLLDGKYQVTWIKLNMMPWLVIAIEKVT